MAYQNKVVYVVSGEAASQEVIVRQRSQYEDYVRETMNRKFRKTNLTWNMNKAGNFDFRLEFIK